MHAPTGTTPRSKCTTSATCSKLPPSENSAPAVFSINTVKPCLAKIQSAARHRDRRSHACQTLIAARPAKRSRMQNQILGAQINRSFQLTPKRLHRLCQELFSRAGQVDQVIGVNNQWLKVVLLPQGIHLIALRRC